MNSELLVIQGTSPTVTGDIGDGAAYSFLGSDSFWTELDAFFRCNSIHKHKQMLQGIRYTLPPN